MDWVANLYIIMDRSNPILPKTRGVVSCIQGVDNSASHASHAKGISTHFCRFSERYLHCINPLFTSASMKPRVPSTKDRSLYPHARLQGIATPQCRPCSEHLKDSRKKEPLPPKFLQKGCRRSPPVSKVVFATRGFWQILSPSNLAQNNCQQGGSHVGLQERIPSAQGHNSSIKFDQSNHLNLSTFCWALHDTVRNLTTKSTNPTIRVNENSTNRALSLSVSFILQRPIRINQNGLLRNSSCQRSWFPMLQPVAQKTQRFTFRFVYVDKRVAGGALPT